MRLLKKNLRNTVENCDKYKLFWENLSNKKELQKSPVQEMFSKMRAHNFDQMEEVAKSYNSFCLAMADDKIIDSVDCLTNLIDFLHADDLLNGKESKFKALYEPSVILRNEIMNAHAVISENKEALLSEDVELFFRKLLDALKKFTLSTKPGDKNKLSQLSFPVILPNFCSPWKRHL